MTPYKFYLQTLSFMFDICRIKDFSSHFHLGFSGIWRLGSLHNTNLMRLRQIHISSVMVKISYVALMFLQSLGITSNVLVLMWVRPRGFISVKFLLVAFAVLFDIL